MRKSQARASPHPTPTRSPAADRVAVHRCDGGLLETLQRGVGALEQTPELALAREEEAAPLLDGGGPGVSGVRARGEHRRCDVMDGGELCDERIEELGNISAALAKWWNFNRKNIDSIV